MRYDIISGILVLLTFIILIPISSAVDSDLNSGLLWEGNFSECGPGDINATIGNITHYGGGVVCGNDGYGDYIDMDEIDNPNYNRLDNLTIKKVLANYTMTWVIWAEMGADISNERHVLVGAETIAPNTQRADIFRFDTRPIVEGYTSFTQYNNGSGNINWQGIAPFNATTFRGHGINRLVLMLNGTHLFMIVNNTIINVTKRPVNQPGNMSSNEPFYLGDRQFAFSEFYDGRVWQMTVWDHNLSCNPDMSVNNTCKTGSDLAYLWNDFPENQSIPQYPYPAPPPIIEDYNISNCQQLQDMENDTTANYHLITDIYCNNTPFTPISAFTGNFFGNGHTIYDLNISGTGNNQGLFSSTSGSTIISDITIDGCSLSGSGDNHGCLIGNAGGNMTNIFVIDADITGDTSVGCVIGRGLGMCIENMSCIDMDISGISRIGGLIGEIENSNLRQSVSRTGNVTASVSLSGGFIGFITNSGIQDAYSRNISVSGPGGTFMGQAVAGSFVNRTYVDNYKGISTTCVAGASAGNPYNSYHNSDTCVSGKSEGLDTFQMTRYQNYNFSFTDIWYINQHIEPPMLAYEFVIRDDTQPPICGLSDAVVLEGSPYLFNTTCTDDHFIRDINVTCAEIENGNLMFNFSSIELNISSYLLENQTADLYNFTTCVLRSSDWENNTNIESFDINIKPEAVLKTNVCPEDQGVIILLIGLFFGALAMIISGFWLRVGFLSFFGGAFLGILSWTLSACNEMVGFILGAFAVVIMGVSFFVIPYVRNATRMW